MIRSPPRAGAGSIATAQLGSRANLGAVGRESERRIAPGNPAIGKEGDGVAGLAKHRASEPALLIDSQASPMRTNLDCAFPDGVAFIGCGQFTGEIGSAHADPGQRRLDPIGLLGGNAGSKSKYPPGNVDYHVVDAAIAGIDIAIQANGRRRAQLQPRLVQELDLKHASRPGLHRLVAIDGKIDTQFT
jgi:hypothetical protein